VRLTIGAADRGGSPDRSNHLQRAQESIFSQQRGVVFDGSGDDESVRRVGMHVESVGRQGGGGSQRQGLYTGNA